MTDAITITEIGRGGYAGRTGAVPSAAHPIPRGWTSAPLPALGEGEYAVWRAGSWAVTDQGYAEPAPTLAEAKAHRLAELAVKRWQVECGGIVRNGAAIATDRESQAMLSGALQLVQDDDQVLIDWKADNGWVQLDAVGVTYIAREVGLHKQQAFSREKTLSIEIEACETVQAVAAVDITAGWPSNTAAPE